MSWLDGARLKLTRADAHLHALDSEIASYLALKPYRTVLNVQPSDQSLVMIEIQVDPKPPKSLPLIVGDCLHNLRSCLDHIACAVVMKGGGDCETPRSQFPIHDSGVTASGKPRVISVGPTVAPSFLAFVESLQPYKSGQDPSTHPLSILAHLSNVDKHRTLHGMTGAVVGAECYLHTPNGRIGGPCLIDVAYEETPIAAFRFPEPFSQARYGEMEVEVDTATFVTLQERGPWGDQPVILILNDIVEFIRDTVLPGSEPFLN